jgi:hypothetical protein
MACVSPVPGLAVRLAPSFGDLNVDFIRLDHAQLVASTLFNHVQTFFEVVDLGAELFDLAARFFIGRFLMLELSLQLRHSGYTAPAHPKLALQDHQQGDQHDGDDAIAHGDQRRL